MSGQPPMISPVRNVAGVDIVGEATVSFVLQPGVSRAHRRLAKKNMRFKHVYEAWETQREQHQGLDKANVANVLRQEAKDLAASSDSENSVSHESDDEDEQDDDDEEGRAKRALIDDDGEDDNFMEEHKSHSHALHKRVRRCSGLACPLTCQNKGIFQLKIARTGKLMKDKIEAKLHSATERFERRKTTEGSGS